MSDTQGYEARLLLVFRKLMTAIRILQAESTLCGKITFNQFTILSCVAKTGSLELSILHGLLKVEKSTTTRLVEPLVIEGYLKKKKSDHDSRAIELYLTPDGKKAHEAGKKCVSDFMMRMAHSIPDDAKEEVLHAIGIFIDSIEACCKAD